MINQDTPIPPALSPNLKKRLIEYCVLLICSNKESYAADIIAVLKESDMLVVEGTLYPLLSRLSSAGVLAYGWQESDTGPPRKYYSLTDVGRSVLQEYNQQWQEISATIQSISKEK